MNRSLWIAACVAAAAVALDAVPAPGTDIVPAPGARVGQPVGTGMQRESATSTQQESGTGMQQEPAAGAEQDLEARVKAFLDSHRDQWRDLNVPEEDGRQLHDIIVKNRYTRALEIGTSTGRSGIWIALALSKTGGKLITIDIDEGRHREALANFKEAGVARFIDARLADAHDLVPKLEGPFDFVFIDADKEWYTTYARAVLPKLLEGGCLTAHNVYPAGGRRRGMTGDFYKYITSLPLLETTVTRGGLSISYKRSRK